MIVKEHITHISYLFLNILNFYFFCRKIIIIFISKFIFLSLIYNYVFSSNIFLFNSFASKYDLLVYKL